MIKLEIQTKNVLARFNKVLSNINSIPWTPIGNLVRDSVHQNFESQGRPTKWKPRKVDKPWPILIKSGALKSSIYVEPGKDSVAIGTRMVYAAVQNFGYPKRNISARPYLMVQADDRLKIDNIITNHIKSK